MTGTPQRHRDDASRHGRQRAPLHRRRGALLALAGLTASAAIALTALDTVGVTSAAFTDTSTNAIGSTGSIGGSYDLSLVDGTGSIVPGNPTPLELDTSGVGAIGTGTVGPLTVRVVTTTPATGPVRLTRYNAYPGTRPSDPGTTGPGADPYDYALYTVDVDGTRVATALPAAQLNALGLTLTDWTTNVAKTVDISLSLPQAIGNMYVYDRSLVLGVRFDGSTS